MKGNISTSPVEAWGGVVVGRCSFWCMPVSRMQQACDHVDGSRMTFMGIRLVLS